MNRPMSEQMQKLAERYEKATGKKFDQETNIVVHGKWVKEDDYFCCSKCGQAIAEACVPWFKYCPNCGAKMNRKRKETN